MAKKLHEMIKADDVNTRQCQFPVGFPVRVCDLNVFFINIIQDAVARIKIKCVIKEQNMPCYSVNSF